MREKPNILIIGASGGVACALLQRIPKHRNQIGKLVLVDRSDTMLRNPSVPDLGYDFVQTSVDVNPGPEAYVQLLAEKAIDLVVDLSVNETRAMLEASDGQDVSYVSTGIANLPDQNFDEVVLDIYRRKDGEWQAPHVLCAGMNPGVVNMWVRHGIELFGVPDQVVHFEYDTAQPLSGWAPVITWSRETFLDEILNDPAGYMEGRDKVRAFYPNPLKHRVPTKEVLSPLIELRNYPRGFLLLHEENITIAQKYDVPSRFLFAMDARSMDHLERMYDELGTVPLETLALGDNKKIHLKGSVTVGVRLDYKERAVYFFNTTSHENVLGCSGSCWQVAAGLQAVLATFLTDRLENRLYFVEDLYNTSCRKAVWENLSMEQVGIDFGAGKGRHGYGGR